MEQRRERGLKKLPDGRWQWSYQDPNGEYHRHIARTKGEARAYLEKVHTEIREGRYLNRRKEVKTTFKDAVKRFLEWSKANKRRSTFEGDEWAADYWLASPHLAGKRLDKITAGDVAAFVQVLRTTPKQPHVGGIRCLASGKWQASWFEAGHQHRITAKSEADARTILKEALEKRANTSGPLDALLSKRAIDIILARLKRLYSLCMTWGLCSANPALKIPLFREDAKRVRYLTEDEELSLLAHCPPYLKRIVRFALQTGARKGEILGAKWSDVDIKGAVLTVPGSQAKGGRNRHIHLNAVALSILNELPRSMNREAYVFGSGMDKLPTTFERHWRQALSEAGLRDFHFHDLRHTYASRLVMAGVDLAVLRELLGHRDFEMTLRYAHLQPSRLKAAVAILERQDLQNTCDSNNGPLRATGANAL
jgi:integrase